MVREHKLGLIGLALIFAQVEAYAQTRKQITWRRFMLVSFTVLFGVGHAAVVEAEEGLWSTDESIFAQMNVFCTRTYVCGPSTDIVYGSDKKVVSTSPRLVQGVCSTGNGPIDSCNVCLTNPPTERCEWHLEPK